MEFEKNALTVHRVWANRFRLPGSGPECPDKDVQQVLGIDWEYDGIGFGRCEFLFEENGTAIKVESEGMAKQDSKEFLRLLFEKIVDMSEVKW